MTKAYLITPDKRISDIDVVYPEDLKPGECLVSVDIPPGHGKTTDSTVAHGTVAYKAATMTKYAIVRTNGGAGARDRVVHSSFTMRYDDLPEDKMELVSKLTKTTPCKLGRYSQRLYLLKGPVEFLVLRDGWISDEEHSYHIVWDGENLTVDRWIEPLNEDYCEGWC